jgi:uncharacterized protein YndB with AHSA1/START domain
MDDVFRSLADPTRRRLLDLLRSREPQTLSELVEAIAPDGSMTRFGVMKHLASLEEAGLVVTRKIGREKLHYLNAAPIQELADRWIARFAAPLVQRMADVKRIAEHGASTMTAPRQVYEIFIRADAATIWRALTRPELTEHYYGSRIESDLKKGSPFRYLTPGDQPLMIDGRILEIDPPHRLVTTFAAKWDPAMHGDRPSRVTYELTHDDFDGETATYKVVAQGWSRILSGMKTLIETGKPLGAAA